MQKAKENRTVHIVLSDMTQIKIKFGTQKIWMQTM